MEILYRNWFETRTFRESHVYKSHREFPIFTHFISTFATCAESRAIWNTFSVEISEIYTKSPMRNLSHDLCGCQINSVRFHRYHIPPPVELCVNSNIAKYNQIFSIRRYAKAPLQPVAERLKTRKLQVKCLSCCERKSIEINWEEMLVRAFNQVKLVALLCCNVQLKASTHLAPHLEISLQKTNNTSQRSLLCFGSLEFDI